MNTVDLVIVLDTSGSMLGFLDTAIQFLKDVIGQFEISFDETRIALITFSNQARLEFDLVRYTSLQDYTFALERVRVRGNETLPC